ncbi:hypothetical protein BGZ60DRAFT_523389 [Tricladium varicosporioides]|nr:hypothetical protein BGZ60DRAFT_523389 [Hymenoscyphus varicosporioides]
MSPILSRALTRTRGQLAFPKPAQITRRSYETMVKTEKGHRAQADWSRQWRKVGGVALMYFPVVAVVMFWPYGVKPVMDRVRW